MKGGLCTTGALEGKIFPSETQNSVHFRFFQESDLSRIELMGVRRMEGVSQAWGNVEGWLLLQNHITQSVLDSGHPLARKSHEELGG